MKKTLISLLFFVFTFTGFSATSDELLRPDDAFKASLSQSSPDSIQATWDIADGYYMYRKRFSFESNTAGVTLGTPAFPKGKIKDDPGFGKVETYRNKIVVNIPINRSDTAPTNFSLKTKSQGCADIGVCYPPQKKTLTLQLAVLETEIPQATNEEKPSKGGLNLAKELGISTLGDANAPLHPDEAFGFDIVADDKQNLSVRWSITPGHYLYQHKLGFKITEPTSGISLGKPVLPKGKAENDQYFGDIVTYNKNFDVKLPLIGNADSATVKVSYQGCSKLTGICYPPQTKSQTIDLTAAAPAQTNVTSTTINAASKPATTDSTTSDEITFNNSQSISTGNSFLDKSLNSKSLWSIFFAALGAGLLLAFTACMYPMIPILSSIIVGQGEKVSMWKGLSLSSIYVLSLAVTFGIVGAITASVAGGIGVCYT